MFPSVSCTSVKYLCAHFQSLCLLVTSRGRCNIRNRQYMPFPAKAQRFQTYKLIICKCLRVCRWDRRWRCLQDVPLHSFYVERLLSLPRTVSRCLSYDSPINIQDETISKTVVKREIFTFFNVTGHLWDRTTLQNTYQNKTLLLHSAGISHVKCASLGFIWEEDCYKWQTEWEIFFNTV